MTASSASAVAGDGLVQRAAQTVTVALTDLNDSPPVFEAGDALPVREDVAVHDDAAQRGDAAVIHRVRARPDVDGDTVVYSLKEADDHAAFGINQDGEIWLRQRPDHDSGGTAYQVTVVATVGAQSAEKTLRFAVIDLNDEVPVVSGTGTAAVDEGVAAHDDAARRGDAAVVYRAAAAHDDAGPAVIWELGGDHRAAFGVNDDGEVWFRREPDHERQPVYEITLTAVSGALRSRPHKVTVAVGNRLDEAVEIVSPGPLSVKETAGVGAAVGRLAASTVEAGAEEHPVREDGGHAALAVDAAGRITLAAAVDYEGLTEDQQQHGLALQVRAVMTRGEEAPVASPAVTIHVRVIDQDDAPTGLRLADVVASLGETHDMSARVKVADLVVDDPDSNPAFRHHSFTLSGADAELFEVVGGALYLKANTPLDHEAAPRLDVTVGLDGTAFTADYRLAVENRNDMALVLDETARVEVDEGVLQTGHAVRAVRQDAAGGPVRYAVTGGQDAGLFAIDAVTGELRFLAAPDHERPRDRDRDNIHEVVVTASSASAVAGDGLVQRAAQTVTVTLTDLNDSPPVFEAGDALPVREDVAVHDDAAQRGDAAVIHRVRARPDVDGDTVVYSLKEADDHAAFGINQDGEIWLRQRPDHDSGGTAYQVTVVATVGAQSAEKTLRFAVIDLNDEVPVVSGTGTAAVDEGVAAHDDAARRGDAAVVYRAAAAHDDAGPAVIWELGGDHRAAFGVNDDGEVWFRREPDHERQPVYEITLTAVSGALRSRPHKVTVTVGNRLDEAVEIVSPGPLSVKETAGVGAAVGRLAASTVEAGAKSVLFGKTGGHAALAVDAAGRITLAAAVDYEGLTEDQQQHGLALQVRAVMTRGEEAPVASPAVTIHVRVIDQDDLPTGLRLADVVAGLARRMTPLPG